MKNLNATLLMALAIMTAHALELPEIFGDNMMLQQQSRAKTWGWAKKNSVVEVKTTWSKEKHVATADATGKWVVEIATPKASYDTYKVTVKG